MEESGFDVNEKRVPSNPQIYQVFCQNLIVSWQSFDFSFKSAKHLLSRIILLATLLFCVSLFNLSARYNLIRFSYLMVAIIL